MNSIVYQGVMFDKQRFKPTEIIFSEYSTQPSRIHNESEKIVSVG